MMNVIRVGSVRRPRSASAAFPIATSSRERSKVTASSSEIRSPSSALSRICLTPSSSTTLMPTPAPAKPPPPLLGRLRQAYGSYDELLTLDEPELRHVPELARVSRELEERDQPGSLAWAELIAELLEIARQEARRIAVPLARLEREALRLGARLPQGGDERSLERDDALGDRLGGGPDGEHHRQARPFAPEAAEVVVRCRILERRLERGVADQQLGVRFLAERHVVGVGQQHLREHDRGGALGRDRDRPHLLERCPRDELDRVDRSLGRDAEPRQDPQPRGVARVLDRRDRREVDLAVDQPPVQIGGDADDLVDLGVEPEEDGRHVHVRDAAEPDHARPTASSAERRSRKSRSSMMCSSSKTNT